MNKQKILIGDKEYIVEIADTPELQEKGLQNRESLDQDKGMLFVYPEEQEEVKFYMKDTNFPLDQIAINKDYEVTKVHTAQALDETLVPFENVKYLLEVNAGSGIEVGDELEFDESSDEYVMQVLSPDGTPQYFLKGGERIFSRKSTVQFIKWAKKAYKVRKDKEAYDKICKRLGKRMFREIKAQDSREPEYVSQ